MPFVAVRIASKPNTTMTAVKIAAAATSSCICCLNDLPPSSPERSRGAPPSKVVTLAAADFFAGFSFGAPFASALPLPRPMFNARRFIAMFYPSMPPLIGGATPSLARVRQRAPPRACPARAPLPLNPRLQELAVVDEFVHVQLPPQPAVAVHEAGALPRLLAPPRLALELLEFAQAEHPVDQQRRAHVGASRDEQQPRVRRCRRRVAALECREIDHAEEVAADVGEPAKPRLRERHVRDRRNRNHLARLLELDEPELVADLHAEPRRRRVRRRRLVQPANEVLLELAQADPACHRRSVPSPPRRAARSSRGAAPRRSA